MAKVIFYEKPGCIGNAQQKKLLVSSGHELDVRDMTTAPWSPEKLRRFFGDRPVAEWFNLTSPRVKAGEIKPDDLDENEALSILCSDPLLIRRPLIEVEGRCEVGFERELIADWIGLAESDADVGEGCPSTGGAD